jgi:hypothetical protein
MPVDQASRHSIELNPKLRDPGDMNAGGDLGERCVRQVGVLATCDCPARPSGRPLMINSVSRRGHRQILLATFFDPKPRFRRSYPLFKRHADVTSA